jgi:hypothetical protein
VLGVSTATVKRRLNRGLRLLTERLGDLRPGDTPPGAALAGTVQAAHQAGIIHRDLKPATSCSPRTARPRSPTSAWRGTLAASRP